MSSTRQEFLRAAAAAVLAVGAGGALAACGGDSEADAPAPALPAGGSDTGSGNGGAAVAPVSVRAMMPFPLYLAFIADVAAVSGGFMERAGVDLELEFARSAPQALQQLAAGNVLLVRNAPIAVVKAVSYEDAPFVTFGTVNQEILYVLVSSPDAPVDSLARLEGETVGLATLAGNAEDTLNLVLASGGIDGAAVERVAVGNEAAGYSFVEDGRVAAIFATRESAASMEQAGLAPHVAEIEDANPLLGTCLVTTRERLASEREALVRYLRGLHEAMTALLDGRLAELAPAITAEWELPQLADPTAAAPVVDAISSMWVAAGRENLLRNVPERWAAGVEQFEQLKIAKPGSDPASFYTNEILEEALAS